MSPGDWAGLFFVTSIALSATSLTFLVAWLRARERAIRAELRLEERGGVRKTAEHEQRGGDLEVIAAEIKRLGEGQEFVMELLRQRRLSEARPGAAAELPPGSR